MAAAWSGLATGASLLSEVFDGVWSESLFFADGARWPVLDGGGDFKRGDVGHDGVFCPDFICLSEERPPSSTESTLWGCNTGLCADKARWTAAAEGTVDKDPVTVVFLVGLNS